MSRSRAWFMAVLGCLLVLSGCAGPSRTDADYRLKAANTAEATASEVQTARIAVDAAARDRGFGPYLSVLLGTAESNAEEIHSGFAAVQPPDARADELHDQLDELLSEVDEVLRELRVAVRRGRLDELPEIAEPLPELYRQLDEFEQAHS